MQPNPIAFFSPPKETAIRNFTLKKFPSSKPNEFNFICLNKQLGKGAYGDVYLGYQTEPLSLEQKPDFAVKVISKSRLNERGVDLRYLQTEV